MQVLEPVLRPILGPYLTYQVVVCARGDPANGPVARHRVSDWVERVAGCAATTASRVARRTGVFLLAEPRRRDRRIARHGLLPAPMARQQGQSRSLWRTEPRRRAGASLARRRVTPRQAGDRNRLCGHLRADCVAVPDPVRRIPAPALPGRIASSGDAKPCRRRSAFTRRRAWHADAECQRQSPGQQCREHAVRPPAHREPADGRPPRSAHGARYRTWRRCNGRRRQAVTPASRSTSWSCRAKW